MSIDHRLERLARATDGVRPTPQFTDCVMAAIATEGGWWSFLPLRVVPVLAILAAVAVVWAYRSAHELDDAATRSLDTLEVEW
jgi:hypothetical protein